MKTALLAVSLMLVTGYAFAEGKPSNNPDAKAVDQACAAEAQTAGCADARVGTGLLKCIRDHKVAHEKDFKISESCRIAIDKAQTKGK